MKNKIARQMPAVCILATFFALVFGQSAFAASGNSSVGTYAGGGGNTQAQISSPDPTGTASAPSSQSTGALPFTGFDLALAAGGGLLLLGAGALMAMAASRRSHADQS